MPKKLLMLTYEFPPAGGGGVQRMTKFARYLSGCGWEPLVVTAGPVPGRATDPSLAEEVRDVTVWRTPARNASAAIARLLAPLKRLRRGSAAGPAVAPKTEGAHRPPLSARLARYFTMDDASLWVGPAVRLAVKLGREQGVAAVLASGPPFSVTLAGKRVAAELGVPLVVDLRDAWRDNPVAWFPDATARGKSEDVERDVMAAATVVTATTPTIAAEARSMGGVDVRHLPNGFDPSDVTAWRPASDGPLRLVFMGKVYRGLTEPWDLIAAITRLRNTDPTAAVSLEIVGDASQEVRDVARSAGIDVTFTGYLSHADAVERVATADVALVLIADRPGAGVHVPGKVFEYLGIGLPVLAIVPEHGEAAELIRTAKAGWVFPPHDVDGVAALLSRLSGDKRSGRRWAGPDA